jgi:hypothetical protein
LTIEARIIGDEVWVDGWLLGLVVAHGIPESVKDAFIYDMENATLFEDDKRVMQKDEVLDAAQQEGYESALDDTLKAAKLEARGGLIRIASLESIIKQLKESE